MANEVRLIDANALISKLHRMPIFEKNDFDKTMLYVEKSIIEAMPTVDAEPVVHGHWVKYNFLGHDQFACSVCQTLGSPQWKRCPVCEAKMDGERKDND